MRRLLATGLAISAIGLSTSCYTYAGGFAIALDGDAVRRDAVLAAVARLADERSMERIRDEYAGPFTVGGVEFTTAAVYRLHSPADAPGESFRIYVNVATGGGSVRVVVRDYDRATASPYVRDVQASLAREIGEHVSPDRITAVDQRVGPGCYAP